MEEDSVQLPTYFDDLVPSEDDESSTVQSEFRFSPTLIDLCSEEFKNQILLDDFNVDELSELPPHLFESLVMSLPAAALDTLEHRSKLRRRSKELEDGDESYPDGEMKRLKRSGAFDEAWRKLFEMRFVRDCRYLGLQASDWEDDWQQAYWQRHLQECVDFATEKAFQPCFKGHLSQMLVSTTLSKVIGYKMSSPSMSESMKLSYHFQQFGHYAWCLRIRNVICTPEICDLLKTCELKCLILRRIRSEKEVDALSELLKQNMRSLRSLELIDSTLSSTDVERICHSLCSKELKTHLLQDLLVVNSIITHPNGCDAFLLLGGSLRSVSICNTRICRDFADRFLNVLIRTSSSVEVLNLSDNSVSGWFSNFNKISSPIHSLTSLRKLILRGNNMREMDIVDLNLALIYLPNLDTLDLKDNPIGDEGVRNLISCILHMADRNSFLKHLNLDNCLLSCKSAARLFETLPSLTNQLMSLSVADNNLGSGIAAPLSRLLSTSILDLNIELTGLGASGFEILGQEIGEGLQLKNINISRNRGKSATAKIISKLMSNAPHLRKIEAAQNLMPLEAMLEVCSTLKNKKGSLEMVDLSGNIYNPSLDAVAKEFTLEGNGKPVVLLPIFECGPFIHDDDP